jgi:hypothetical protein
MSFTVENIDGRRGIWLRNRPEATVFEAVALLTRTSQQTLNDLFRSAMKPIESEVVTAAAVFFQKFFLQESPWEFHPRVVLVACVNLAAKTEEFHAITLSNVINGLPDASKLKEHVPRVEMRLLAAVGYDLVVEQPWSTQLFWVDELKSSFNDQKSVVHMKVYDMSGDLMRLWQWTDAALVFPFPKLATAAVLRACIAIDDQVGANNSPEESYESLSRLISEIMSRYLPGVDLQRLLIDVETVVYRFGKFETLLKEEIQLELE